jgi:hypothetical protein
MQSSSSSTANSQNQHCLTKKFPDIPRNSISAFESLENSQTIKGVSKVANYTDKELVRSGGLHTLAWSGGDSLPNFDS